MSFEAHGNRKTCSEHKTRYGRRPNWWATLTEEQREKHRERRRAWNQTPAGKAKMRRHASRPDVKAKLRARYVEERALLRAIRQLENLVR